ncbi:hypothetical protein THAOC_18544, partial [Thalassiosira oceanica]
MTMKADSDSKSKLSVVEEGLVLYNSSLIRESKNCSVDGSSGPEGEQDAAYADLPLNHSLTVAFVVQRLLEYFKSQTSFRQNNVKKKTAYRKRLDDEEQQQVIEDKRKRARDVDWDVVLSHGNGTATPLMLVDGYN